MEPKSKLKLSLFSWVVLSCISCQKDQPDASSNSAFRPPVADAGIDKVITLPVNSVALDGSRSADPDNDIASYRWSNIEGPSKVAIPVANAAQVQVENLVQGMYKFELKVTDAKGLFSRDTVQVTVNEGSTGVANNLQCGSNRPLVNARLIPVGNLSLPRRGITVAAAGGEVVFAGGVDQNGAPISRVDIYDVAGRSWSTAELSEGRYMIAAVANGNKIFFGGGDIGDGTSPVAAVDIYDASTGSWSRSSLSLAGNSIAAAAVGNKVLFAGGDGAFSGGWQRGRQVDIFDVVTSTWSATSLPQVKRGGHLALTSGNKVYVAGGEGWPGNPVPGTWFASNTIDVYDDAASSWSVASLGEGKLALAGAAVDDKVIWAGGITGFYASSLHTSCLVSVMDVNTGRSTTEYLSSPATWWVNDGQRAVVQDKKVIFYRTEGDNANKFDIYDVNTNTWTIGVLPMRIIGASIIAVNNTVLIAGGTVDGTLSTKVWKLEF